MTLSKREKTILLVTAAVLGLLGLDHYVVRPYQDSLNQLENRRVLLERQLDEARLTFMASDRAGRRWSQFRASGLQTNASATENNLLNAVQDWSRASRLTLSSLRPDRVATAHGLQEMNFQAAAQGTMRTISAFLYEVETTGHPIRLRELQIASRTDGTDDLSVQMRLSTIWDDPESKDNPANKTSSQASARSTP